MAFVGTCLAWFLQTHMGRRTIYLYGLICMLPIMWIVAFLEFAPNANGPSIKWAQSGILLFWFFTYGKQKCPTTSAPTSHTNAPIQESQSAPSPTPSPPKWVPPTSAAEPSPSGATCTTSSPSSTQSSHRTCSIPPKGTSRGKPLSPPLFSPRYWLCGPTLGCPRPRA